MSSWRKRALRDKPKPAQDQPTAKVHAEPRSKRTRPKQTGPKRIVYSNRPPTQLITGGAIKVIGDLAPDIWVGPGEVIDDKEWEKWGKEYREYLEKYQEYLKYRETSEADQHPEPPAVPDRQHDITRHLVTDKLGKEYTVYTFPVPKKLYVAQYSMIANGLIWPVSHSTDADALRDPLELKEVLHKHNSTYDYVEHRIVPKMTSIQVQPNGLGDKGVGLKNLVAKLRDKGHPTMIIFTGDSPIGNDKSAFRMIRNKTELELGDNDRAMSVQVIREGVEQVPEDKEYADIFPDAFYDNPEEYSASMLLVAKRLKHIQDTGQDLKEPEGPDDTPIRSENFHYAKFEDRIVNFVLKNKGQVIFINDWDGSQSSIHPVPNQARMQPDAIKQVRTLLEMERDADEKLKESGESPKGTEDKNSMSLPVARYALLTGRGYSDEAKNGVMDLIEASIDDNYSEAGDATQIKTLFNNYLQGEFYHSLVAGIREAGKVTIHGFNLDNAEYGDEKSFVDEARKRMQLILDSPEFDIFKAYPFYIENLTTEILQDAEERKKFFNSFSRVQIPKADTAALDRFKKLKEKIEEEIKNNRGERETHAAVRDILKQAEFQIFNPQRKAYPLGIQENVGGIEVNFRIAQIAGDNTGNARVRARLKELEEEIRKELEKLEVDDVFNRERRPSGDLGKESSNVRKMRTYIESELVTQDFWRDPNEDWQFFKEFNDLGNRAIAQLRHDRIISDQDMLWTHDYQCVNISGESVFNAGESIKAATPADGASAGMPGGDPADNLFSRDIYTHHVPVPTLDYLRETKVRVRHGDQETLDEILETEYFQDYIKQLASHSLITFQRGSDMKNFIEIVADRDPQFRKNNPNAPLLLEKLHFEIGECATLNMFGRQVKIMNVALGVSLKEGLDAARKQVDKLDQTTFHAATIERMHIELDEELPEGGTIRLKKFLGHLLNNPDTPKEELFKEPGNEPYDPERHEHRIFLSMHRNDYSKSTLEKMYAADYYLHMHPEEIHKTHFVFFLQPTRGEVSTYKHYHRDVENLARDLRDKYGDSIVIVPAGLDWEDYLGLLRHPNTVAFLGTGLKDGHDLTLREAACSRADFLLDPSRPCKDEALAIVTTSGTGASDVLGGTKENPGAYVLDTEGQTFWQRVAQITGVIQDINKLATTSEGEKELAKRYRTATAASVFYGSEQISQEMDEPAETADEQGPVLHYSVVPKEPELSVQEQIIEDIHTLAREQKGEEILERRYRRAASNSAMFTPEKYQDRVMAVHHLEQYSTEWEVDHFANTVAKSATDKRRPMLVLDMDGNIVIGYNVRKQDNKGRNVFLKLNENPDKKDAMSQQATRANYIRGREAGLQFDNPERQAIPFGRNIERLVADGKVEPGIFATMGLDVRLPMNLVDMINENIAMAYPKEGEVEPDRKFDLVILTSRDKIETQRILKESGIKHPELLTLITDSGARIYVGGKEEKVRELSEKEEKFLEEIKVSELEDRIFSILSEFGLEPKEKPHLIIEHKAIAINLHYRHILEDCRRILIESGAEEDKAKEGSDLDKAIGKAIQEAMDNYIESSSPKEGEDPVFEALSAPATVEVKIIAMNKGIGLEALMKEVVDKGKYTPSCVVYSGDDICKVRDGKPLRGTDYDAFKIAPALQRQYSIPFFTMHTQHPLSKILGAGLDAQPDPDKAASNMWIAPDIVVPDPKRAASLVVRIVRDAHERSLRVEKSRVAQIRRERYAQESAGHAVH